MSDPVDQLGEFETQPVSIFSNLKPQRLLLNLDGTIHMLAIAGQHLLAKSWANGWLTEI